MKTQQQELIEFFKSQGFETETHIVEDDVKVFQRVDVVKNNERRGSFLFVNGEQKDGHQIDKLRNKPTN